MAKLFFFWILALLLVQGPFVLTSDLCENVSKSYRDLCHEIDDSDLTRSQKIDLIENIGEVETYEPILESRFEKDYCSKNDCLIPPYSVKDFDYSVLNYVLYVSIFLTIIYLLSRLIKKFWRIR